MFIYFYISVCLSQYFCLFLCLPPFGWQRAFFISSRSPQFPSSSICLYNSVSSCISEAGSLLVSLISFLCCSLCHTSLSQLFLPAIHSTFFPICVSFAHFLILMSFCITIVSFCPPHFLASLPRYLPLPICCLHSFSFSLVHLHSCSLPCHSLSFFPSFPFCLSHPSLSHMLSSLTPPSACWDGNRTMPVRRRGAAECHFCIVFTLPLVRMCESAAMFGGRKYVAIFVTDTQLKVIQCHHFTQM